MHFNNNVLKTGKVFPPTITCFGWHNHRTDAGGPAIQQTTAATSGTPLPSVLTKTGSVFVLANQSSIRITHMYQLVVVKSMGFVQNNVNLDNMNVMLVNLWKTNSSADILSFTR
eukprot:Lithocolla_globosa_v1_NODE_5378_length_1251_cov_5.956522.p3 type:complete len:114 gc:universal NODE_5378_length_1251_cov_5.956522:375-716(+)